MLKRFRLRTTRARSKSFSMTTPPINSIPPTTTPPGGRGDSSDGAAVDIVLDAFAYRQFDSSDYAGTKIPVSKESFMGRVHAFYSARKAMADEFGDRPALVDGYAPFCKHIFMPNFDDRIVDGALRIDAQNRHMLRSSYEARSDEELPVLVRYFPRGAVQPPPAKFLDLILYSRDQIIKENEAMGRPSDDVCDAPWRLIAVKGQAEPFETPMTPITMMRNELISQGGSGVPIDRDAYMKSVDFWRDHAIII